MSYFVMPHLIEGLVSGAIALSEKEAAMIGTIELLVLAGTILALSQRIGVLGRRKLAIIGIVLATVSFFASMLFASVIPIVVCRVAAGIGAGCAMAAANGLAASYDEPEQVYAWSFIVLMPISAVMIAVMPHFVELWGHSGAYGYQAAFAIIYLTVVVLFFPKDAPATEASVAKRWIPRPYDIVIISAIFLFLVCDAGIWSFTERVGMSIGVDMRTIGLVLGFAVIMVPVGSGLASTVGMRFGRYVPLVVGLTLMASTVYLLTNTGTKPIYMGAQVFYNFIYAFTIPFIYGTAAAMDSKGRVVVAAMGVGLVGGAIAPTLSATLVEATGNYGVLGLVYGSVFLVVLGLSATVIHLVKLDSH